eukprot:m.129233 g.129233  ORF g.129233 m.129233 type:complete len:286 (-) comp19936_c1_seq1:59-916(-)
MRSPVFLLFLLLLGLTLQPCTGRSVRNEDMASAATETVVSEENNADQATSQQESDIDPWILPVEESSDPSNNDETVAGIDTEQKSSVSNKGTGDNRNGGDSRNGTSGGNSNGHGPDEVNQGCRPLDPGNFSQMLDCHFGKGAYDWLAHDMTDFCSASLTHILGHELMPEAPDDILKVVRALVTADTNRNGDLECKEHKDFCTAMFPCVLDPCPGNFMDFVRQTVVSSGYGGASFPTILGNAYLTQNVWWHPRVAGGLTAADANGNSILECSEYTAFCTAMAVHGS